MAMHDAAVGCRGVKHTYFNPRPVQLDPGITTVIGLPNFPAYPSGHSTFSAAAAMVLGYGGIHYRSDIERGKQHGARIGGYAVRFAQQDGAN